LRVTVAWVIGTTDVTKPTDLNPLPAVPVVPDVVVVVVVAIVEVELLDWLLDWPLGEEPPQAARPNAAATIPTSPVCKRRFIAKYLAQARLICVGR